MDKLDSFGTSTKRIEMLLHKVATFIRQNRRPYKWTAWSSALRTLAGDETTETEGFFLLLRRLKVLRKVASTQGWNVRLSGIYLH